MSELDTIGSLVRKAESDFINGNITVSKYVNESPCDDLAKISAYLNSKHTSGDKDTLNRDKPFFNITVAKKNIVARATDLDRKNIRAKASKMKDELASFLFTIKVQQWMKDSKFGIFLNNWGDTLAGYNSAIVKSVENKDGLHVMVMDWQKMIVDFIDFDSNPKIEILELTEAQLRQNKSYDQDMVEALCNALTVRTLTNKQKKDNKPNFIKLYEIHGNLPLSYLTDKEEDEYTYVQQMHVISFVASKQKGKFDDYTLVSGREKKDPYMLTYLIPSTDGSISLNGAVKNLFEAQWMKNHTVKAIKDYLDLASKLIYQTSDSSFANKNALSAIESGDIMVHKENMPITQVQNSTNDVTALTNFGVMWENLASDLANVPDILQGDNMPSGTAFRQAAIVQQEAHSNFGVMIENKGLFLEELFKEHITPYILKQMDTTEEISATLDSYGIDKIDQMYIGSEAVKRFNHKAVEAVINRTELPNLDQERAGVQQELAQSSQRYLKPSDIETKTWKEVLGDFEASMVYDIVDENRDVQATLDTLNNTFQILASNPAILQNPQAKMLFNKILSASGEVSPVELANVPEPALVGVENQNV